MTDPAIAYVQRVLRETGMNPNQLAQRARVSHSTINRPLTIPNWPHKISRTTIDKIRAATGIEPDEIEGLGPLLDLGADADPDHISIPAWDVQAGAGNGVIPPDYPEIADRLTFPVGYLRSFTKAPLTDLRIITVKGDSMLDTLQNNDVVMIDSTKNSLAYDGLFVLNLDGAVHVKRVTRGSKPGWVAIVSDNKAKYPAFEREAGDVRVIGKVIWKGTRE